MVPSAIFTFPIKKKVTINLNNSCNRTEHIDAIPSSRPVKPSLSVVVALTLILLSSNAQIFERLIINCSL